MDWLAEVVDTAPAGGLALLFAKALLVLSLGALLADDLGMSTAAVRHRVRFATLLCLVALPLLSWVAPHWQVSVPATGFTSQPVALAPLTSLVLAVYLAGVALGSARLLWDLVSLVVVTQRSAPPPQIWAEQLAQLDPSRRVRLRAHRGIDAPFTWGLLRPVILVPLSQTMTAREQRMVLLHELGHIHRGDWLAHLLGQIVGVLYWPIPGLRHTLRQLTLESEQACDNHVLASASAATDYAALLLAQARRHRLRAAVPLSRQSDLAQRIRNICSPQQDHSVMATGWPWLLPLCLLLTLPLAGLRLSERPAPALTEAGTIPLLRFVAPTEDNAPPVAIRPERIPPPSPIPTRPP